MSCRKKRICSILGAVFIGTTVITGCSTGNGQSNGTEAGEATNFGSSQAESVATSRLATEDLFTARDREIGYDEAQCVKISLSDSGSKASGNTVAIEENVITISQEGTYLLSGSISDGQIVIHADESAKIQLVLDGVDITSKTSAAIYAVSADKVFVTMADNSVNTLSTTAAFVTNDENNVDGVIFAKCDLTLNGNGTLNVNCAQGHGIVTKDDLAITSGKYEITAEGNALSGKDSIRIAEGDFCLNSGNDAIQSKNEEDAEMGIVYIADGTFDIEAGGDGVDASNIAQIEGGTWKITSEGKGVKGGVAIFADGGDVTITSTDDSYHSNGEIEFTDGTYTLSSGDDGVHADYNLVFSGGELTLSECNEGMEGEVIIVNGGKVDITSKDDGMNASGGSTSQTADPSAQDGNLSADPTSTTDLEPFGKGTIGARGGRGGGFDINEKASLTINGGYVHVNAGGDGLDSNGELLITGGTVYVDGPTNGGNGAIDCGTEAIVTGGTVIAVGSSQMAVNFGSSSTQCAMMVSAASASGGTITLKDADGAELICYEPLKSFDNVVISTPEIKVGQTYTVTIGTTETEVTMTETIYGTSNGMGGHGGMKNFNKQELDGTAKPEMPEGERPEMPEGERPQKPDAQMPQDDDAV